MRIVCAGGGTLGSVTPLLAVVEELRATNPIEVDWFGTATGPERTLVEAAGGRFHTIPAGKLRRYASARNATDVLRLGGGLAQALWWLAHNSVEVVLTAGGFVAVPVAWAAWFRGVPVFVHQQDVVPGLANKLMVPFARRVTVALECSLKDYPAAKTVCTGNPVRAAFIHPPAPEAARRALGLSPELATVVVLGGGTGAQFLNDLVVPALPRLTAHAQVLHISGPQRSAAQPPQPRYHQLAFTTDTLTVLAAADVVVTRAGMGTLTELAALRRPAIVVPIPDSHQEANARLVAEASAAVVLPQAGLTPEQLLGTVEQLLNDAASRERFGAALARLLPPGAAARVAHEIISATSHHV